jgi:hypothetical protein
VKWYFFDDREKRAVEEALEVLRGASSPQLEVALGGLERLTHAAEIIRTSPSVQRSFHGRMVSSESLVELLCRLPDYDLDLHIPTKAVLGQAYLVAKINFFKGLGYALESAFGPPDLIERIQHEAGQSIYTKLAEELFLSIVTDPHGQYKVKSRAARALFEVWENRLTAEIDDFAPVLEGVWVARNRVRPVMGTLRGTHEFLRLLAETSDHSFFDHFTTDHVAEEEVQAFEEFLFGISHEEISKLRQHLEQKPAAVLSQDDARDILGRSKESWVPLGGPQDFYSSYKKRKVKANYRVITNAPGPKKTAEEYVMIAFLEKEDSLGGLKAATEI